MLQTESYSSILTKLWKTRGNLVQKLNEMYVTMRHFNYNNVATQRKEYRILNEINQTLQVNQDHIYIKI